MSFDAGDRLWLLLAVAALALAYLVAQRRRRSTYTVRFTNLALLDVVAPRRPAWRRHVTAAALLAGAAALVVALAEPTRAVRVPRERATVVLAIDVSLSMQATDVAPSRLDAAREAAADFLDTVPPTVNVGLVQFAGGATVLVAPTTEHDAVRAAIERLDLAEGTAVGEAIFAGLDALRTLPDAVDGEPVPASIVLLSDGTTTAGRTLGEAVAAANSAGVPVSTIAFGTAEGVIVINGNATPVPPDVDVMEAIAEETGGEAFTAESGRELEAAYDDLGSSVGFETERRPIGEWFVGGALLGLLAAGALSLRWFNRMV